MKKYTEKILDQSIWITATPAGYAKAFPFFLTEVGHFFAEKDYTVQRETHNSFLMLYTIHGQGTLQTGACEMLLRRNEAAVINCRMPHMYGSSCEEWEFLWAHFDGSSANVMYDIIYPNHTVYSIHINAADEFEQNMRALLETAKQHDRIAYADISLRLHTLLNMADRLSLAHTFGPQRPDKDVMSALDFIHNHYAHKITIEDMTRDIHISKYHFIRLFRNVMGITPYQYLTNYRINMSKKLLHSTQMSVSEIAEECGFMDTSNFIIHFKKQVGQKPLQYRRDFM